MALLPPVRPQGHGLLEGKTVLVTAAAGTGIGFAAAERAIDEGARVFISDLHEGRLKAAADKLTAKSGKPTGFKLCNVTKEDDVRALVAAAIQDLGHVDVLINNAGLGGTYNVVDMTDEQWYGIIEVSLSSVFRMTRAILPHMTARKSGAIVNNASVLGWRAQAGQSAYAAAKAGVMAFTRCSAMEAASSGVRINAVAPSLAAHAFLNKVMPPGLMEELTKREAFGRAAEIWEVATVMIFLASDYASYMTGEVLPVSNQHG